MVCVREVQRTLAQSVKRLIEDKIAKFGFSDDFDILNDHIKAPGGGIILFQGMQDHTSDSIKSLEGFDIGYCEESHAMTERSLELLRPTIRKDSTCVDCGHPWPMLSPGIFAPACENCEGDFRRPASELWFSWNPRHASDPVDALLRGEKPPPDAVVVEANWRDNPYFPRVLEEERVYDEQAKPIRYGHIWEGEYEPQAIGAIWNRLNFHNNRREEEPEDLGRVVVGVDPAGSSQSGANQTGIIVAGIGADERGYVLGDYSLTGTPEQWGKQAIAAYRLHHADAIVVETNYGGEMCKATIRAIDPLVRVIEVRATRGKHVRAEPISALYDLNKISHVGAFPELEAQMCLVTAAGYEGEGSPDRMDALVWCFTNLFHRMTRVKQSENNPRPTRANSLYNPHRRMQDRRV